MKIGIYEMFYNSFIVSLGFWLNLSCLMDSCSGHTQNLSATKVGQDQTIAGGTATPTTPTPVTPVTPARDASAVVPPTSAQSEEISPPANITGTYLACAAATPVSSTDLEANLSCGLFKSDTNDLVVLKSLATTWNWNLDVSKSSATVVKTDPKDPAHWQVDFKISAASAATVSTALQTSQVNLTVTLLDGTSQALTNDIGDVTSGIPTRIISRLSKDCLDIPNGTNKQGQELIQFDCSTAKPWQTFTLLPIEGVDGEYQIQNFTSGLCMQGSDTVDQSIVQVTCDSAQSKQYFKFTEVTKAGVVAGYTITINATGFCMDMSSTGSSAVARGSTCKDPQAPSADDQIFKLKLP